MPTNTIRSLLSAAVAVVLAGALAGCIAAGPPPSPYAQYGLPYYPPLYGVPPGAPPAPVGVALVAAAPLHLRAGPSVRAPIVATLPPGTPVQALAGRVGGWQQVQSGFGAGWVYARYLAPR